MIENKMTENTRNTGYKLSGAPDNSGVPEFLTISHRVSEYISRNMRNIFYDLSDPSKVPRAAYTRGAEGVLVPLELTGQLKESGQLLNGRFEFYPNPVRAREIIDGYLEPVPNSHRESALEAIKAGIKGQKPKLAEALEARVAASLEEAAAVLGVQ